jgi:hypothetical protein
VPKFYDTGQVVSAYKRDTNGHFFDDETMRYFGCRLIEVINLPDDLGPLVIMRQYRNGFVSTTDKIYRVVWYRPGTDHKCDRCGQLDQRGTVDYLPLDDSVDFMGHDFETLGLARKFAESFDPRVTP